MHDGTGDEQEQYTKKTTTGLQQKIPHQSSTLRHYMPSPAVPYILCTRRNFSIPCHKNEIGLEANLVIFFLSHLASTETVSSELKIV